MKSPWKNIDNETDRLKVPGGWIIRTTEYYIQKSVAVHQIFVKDENHEWIINEKEI